MRGMVSKYMFFEKLFYLFFGNNIVIGRHIKEQLGFLGKIVPEEFKGKEMHDLGCGDGKVTLILKDIFKPKSCIGYDVNKKLVELAQKRGIKTEVLDIEKKIPCGELAIIWGVLHHLNPPYKVLDKIKNNYEYLFLREPLKKGIALFELGKPFKKEVIEKHLKESLGQCKSYIYQNAIFVFWKRH